MKVMSVANAAIISIIALILVLVFVSKANTGIRDISDSAICKESINANSLLRLDKYTAGIDIKCPALFIKVDSEKQDDVFEALALSVADTWNEFGEGAQEIFDVTTDNYCVIRRVVEFRNKETYKGFFDYILRHNPPAFKGSYFSYITSVSETEAVNDLKAMSLQNIDVIDTSAPYAVIFVMAKKKTATRAEAAQIGTTIGAGTGVVIAGVAAIFTGGVSLTATANIVGITSAIGSGAGYAFGSDVPSEFSSGIILMPYTEENLNSLGCTKLPVALSK